MRTMDSPAIINRDIIPPITIQVTPTGWRTPEIYVSLRKLEMSTGAAYEAVASVLKRMVGVPVAQVTIHSQQSWVDPTGRLVFWLEAGRPRLPSPVSAAPLTIDI